MATTAKYKVADGRRLSLYLNDKLELVKDVQLNERTGVPLEAGVKRHDLEGGGVVMLSDDEAEALLSDKTIMSAADYDLFAKAKAAGILPPDNTQAVLMMETLPDGSIAPRLPLVR